MVWKEIPEGTNSKNCYGSTFVCLDRHNLIREEDYGNKQKKSNIVRRKIKDSIRKDEELKHQKRQNKLKRNSITPPCSTLESKTKTEFGFFQ